MMFGMKAKIPGNVIFLLTQPLVGKFPDCPALLTDHEAVAALHVIQAAFYESAAGQHFVSQIEAAKQVEYAIYGYMVQVLATAAQNLLYIVRGRRWSPLDRTWLRWQRCG